MAPKFDLRPLPSRLTQRYRNYGLVTEESMAVLLERAAARMPGHEALVDLTGDELRSFSYSQAHRLVCALAAFLRSRGVGPGDVVLVQSPNSAEVVFACWAAWHLGAVVNPVVDIYREHELRHIVGQVRPDAICAVGAHGGFEPPGVFDALCDEAGISPKARLVIRGESQGWTTWDEAIRGSESVPPALVDPDAPALVLFTSGTTSQPKGALHTSRSLLAETYQMANGWSFGWMDRMYLPLPISHVTGVLFALTVPLSRAGTAVLSRVVSLQQLADEIVDQRVTTTAGTPRLIPFLADAYERAAEARVSLKVFASGGTTVPQVLIEQGEAVGIRPCRIYGMTELPTVTMPCPADTARQRLETDGRLAAGVECEAVDPDTRRPLGGGAEGELRVRGPERMLGYLVAEQTDAQIDDDGWFYTGDLGVVDAEDCVTVTGRIKDIINRGGEKFSCRDIEDLLVAHTGVAAAAVVAAPDRRFGEVPAAFVVPVPGAAPTPEELLAFLSQKGAARQKTPVHWRMVDDLPVNSSGKVKKFELIADLKAALQESGQ